MRSAERKVLTTNVNSAESAAGIIASLCNIPQGVDINDRISRHVRPLYVDWCVCISQNAATNESVMISIWLDKASQSTTPVFSDVFDISIVNAGDALPNVTQTGSRYQCLFIKDIRTNNNGETDSVHRGRLRLPSFDMEFKGATTAYPYNKAIFFATGSSSSANPTIASTFQFVYEDA
jgi:hypothetical protein